ncbi:MAG: IS200/IS605 family transposase [Thermoguttaceae bacterium]|jgi:putative transposase
MGHNYYSEINLHVTWHTKDSLPLLTPQVRDIVYRCLRQRLVNTPGVFFHEIGGIETHVHLVLSVPPTLLVSELVGQLKGASSHEVNQQFDLRDKRLQWQAGYGAVSFGTRDLEWVKEYVQNQEEHHSSGRVYDRLERISEIEARANEEEPRERG